MVFDHKKKEFKIPAGWFILLQNTWVLKQRTSWLSFPEMGDYSISRTKRNQGNKEIDFFISFFFAVT